MKSSVKNSSHKKHNKHHQSQQQQFKPTLYITSTITQQDVLQIKQAFDFYDTNKLGHLTPNDLKQALFKYNYHATIQTVYSILAQYDEQCIGGLTFESFIQIITSNPIEHQSQQDIKKIFKKYDRDNKGYITQKDVQDVIQHVHQSYSKEDVKNMFQVMDLEGNGKVTLNSFIKVMRNSNAFQ